MTGTGDLLDGQSVDPADTAAPGHVCRVKGWSGIERRRAPRDSAIFPKALLEWASACPSGQTREVRSAPALYCLDMDAPLGHHMIAASRDLASIPRGQGEARDEAARTARHRLVPATRQTADDDRPAVERPMQQMLTPRQIALFGHLLTHVKYPLPSSHIVPAPDAKVGFRLMFNAGAMIDRLGYARGGDAYCMLETDLLALARFLVRHEVRREDRWEDGQPSMLIEHINTGRCKATRGVVSINAEVRRDEQWIVEFGSVIQTLARSRASDFSVIGAGLWAAAGRSRIDQWLALWVSGHGYDEGEILDYRVETLARRMALLPRELAESLESTARIGVTLSAPAINPWEARQPATHQGGGASSKADSLGLRHTLSQARNSWRQIRRAMTRLEDRNALQAAQWIHQDNPPDVRPSQAGRAVSRIDLVRLMRWSGPIEGILPRAKRLVSQKWNGLLTSINGSFTALASLIAKKDELSSWAAALRIRYQEWLQWLCAENRPLTPAILNRVNRHLGRDLARLALCSRAERLALRFTPISLVPSGGALLSG